MFLSKNKLISLSFSLNVKFMNLSSIILSFNELILFNSPTIYSNPLAILKKGRLVKVKKCKNDWCKVITGDFNGWVKKGSLWGLI